MSGGTPLLLHVSSYDHGTHKDMFFFRIRRPVRSSVQYANSRSVGKRKKTQ